MKQTAVEWLINTLFNESTIVVTQENNPILFEVLEQAKSMEKEQLEIFFNQGYNQCLIEDLPEKSRKRYDNSEQYYNETYGK